MFVFLKKQPSPRRGEPFCSGLGAQKRQFVTGSWGSETPVCYWDLGLRSASLLRGLGAQKRQFVTGSWGSETPVCFGDLLLPSASLLRGRGAQKRQFVAGTWGSEAPVCYGGPGAQKRQSVTGTWLKSASLLRGFAQKRHFVTGTWGPRARRSHGVRATRSMFMMFSRCQRGIGTPTVVALANFFVICAASRLRVALAFFRGDTTFYIVMPVG